jgi:hypothetical protein
VTSVIDPSTAFFLLPARLWEFMLGYYAASPLRRRPADAALRLATAALPVAAQLVLALAWLSPRWTFPYLLLVTLLAAATLRWGECLMAWPAGVRHGLHALGRYSYSLYLVHFPAIVFCNYVSFEGTRLGYFDPGATLLAVVVTVGGSLALYHFVEQPTRRRFNAVQLMTLTLLAAVLAAVLIQPLVKLSRSKLDETSARIADGLFDRGYYQCDLSLFQEERLARSCLISSPSSASKPMRTFLLAGNSHADMIKLPLGKRLLDAGIQLRYQRGYRAIDADYDGSEILAEARVQNVDVIVLHSSLRPDNGAALVEFVARASDAGVQVALIAALPTYDRPVPRILLEHYRSTGRVNPFGRLLDEQLALTAEYRGILAGIAQAHGGFTLLDPTPLICPSDCLLAGPDYSPYYYDNNHLTLTGAEVLAPLYERIAAL